jgi:hypothetical protein
VTPLPPHIWAAVVDGHKQHPRSQQKRIGPSQVGTPCQRRLAYGLLEAPRVAPEGDPFPSITGTGMHEQLETLFARANAALGWPRYLLERKVEVRPGLTGSCDMYDIAEAAVWDWKGVSTSALAKYRSKGPSEVYRTQAHLYGRGYRNAGFPVKTVNIAFWPRGGWGRDAHWWTEPYDDQIVDDALARIDRTALQLLFARPPGESAAVAVGGASWLSPCSNWAFTFLTTSGCLAVSAAYSSSSS